MALCIPLKTVSENNEYVQEINNLIELLNEPLVLKTNNLKLKWHRIVAMKQRKLVK